MFNLLQNLTLKKDCQYLLSNYTLRQALEKFKYHRYSIVPILDEDGRYFGTLSEGDLLFYIVSQKKFNIYDCEDVYIKDIIIHRSFKTESINSDFETLFKLSLEQSFIPIEDDRGYFIGIIKRKEIIAYLFNDKLNHL